MIDRLRTLDDFDLRNKRVIVRIDINSDVRNGKVLFSERFDAPVETIKELQSKNAKVVLIAHQGRPGEDDFISLKQHFAILKRKIPKLKFVNDIYGDKALREIEKMKARDVLLVENVRFSKDEMKYDRNSMIIKKLAPLFDVYVNDAFSASHREHASIVGFSYILPGLIGRAFEKEIRAIDKVNIRNALLIIGGVKPDDCINLIKKTKGKLMPTGYLGLIVLQSKGIKLGKQDKILRPFDKLVPEIKKILFRTYVPKDVAVENSKGRREDLDLNDLPSKFRMVDLGKKTIEEYCNLIKNAKTIFVKGLPGLCNTKEFTLGTEKIFRAVASSKAYSVIGGGHTLTFIDRLKIKRKNFSYISLSGGALMHYLAEGNLPGIEVLRRRL